MSAAKPGGRLKVVLDTNVYVSAFHSTRGAPFELWCRAVRREYDLITSSPIIGELADVLRADFKRPEPEIVAQLKSLVRVALVVTPKFTLEVIADDPDDDRILECVVAGDADLIVSYDRYLTGMKAFRRIAIVRPIDLLRILGTR